MSSTPKCHIDFETASEVDLRKTGVFRYAEDPSTIVLCMAYKIEGKPVQVWVPTDPFPIDLLDFVRDGGELHAWNAMFEIVIWEMMRKRGLMPAVSEFQWRDTMAAAAYWGLPLSLDMAGEAINASQLKDKDGHRLMMQMNKPRSRDGSGKALSWWHEDEPSKYQELIEYCKKDVLAEIAVSEAIPPLPVSELQVWRADYRMNARGVPIDIELIERLKELAQRSKTELDREMYVVTGGAVATCSQNAKLIKYVNDRLGTEISSLAKDALAEILREGRVWLADGTLHRYKPLTLDVQKVLELRQEAAKTSTAKLDAMLRCVCADGRIRGMQQYYGANRTGRWAGRLVQVQNLPRPEQGIALNAFIHEILEADDADTFEDLCVFTSALGYVSSAIRACFKSEAGNIFVQNDLSQIEARVVAWLAGQKDILDVFARGDDVYTYTAQRIGSDDRQLGKVLVLACGFGMGGAKFLETAKTYGIDLVLSEAEGLVYQWRTANPKIKNFWHTANSACINAIKNPGRVCSIAPNVHVVLSTKGLTAGHMLIRLPSGRDLVYRDAEINPNGKFGAEVTYMGVNQYTRKWERLNTYGGKIVENIVQAVARDVMAVATVTLDGQGLDLCMTVHDELLSEAALPDATSTEKSMTTIMNTPPAWAPGLPVASDGWVGERYRK